jgi:hypothetical protein
MSRPPYPGYPPNYRIVEETGGYARTCVVLEFLSLGKLDNAQLAMLQEQLEACAHRLQQTMVVVERAEVIMPDQFDTLLRAGLRLK